MVSQLPKFVFALKRKGDESRGKAKLADWKSAFPDSDYTLGHSCGGGGKFLLLCF